MNKRIILIIFIVFTLNLYADFIIPRTDPVYEFLEMTHTLRMTNLNHFHYPLYYNDIIEVLTVMSNSQVSEVYSRTAYFHLRRLRLNYDRGIDVAVWPPRRTLTSINEMFRKEAQRKRLFTYSDDETNLYVSGILGFDYDFRESRDDSAHRFHRYFGIESAGNFTSNFGYYLSFRMGNYVGTHSFIEEEKFITKMDGKPFYCADTDRFYRVDMVSELDFKNRYLNLSIGYGSFDIGRSLASSIILNSDVTPYGYLKFNKRFGAFEYNGITAQLTPSPEVIHDSEIPYTPKSMAIQTISYHSPVVSVGVGNTIIYGDRTFDLAYSSPLAVYVIMDNKYHGVDNTLLYAFGEIRPMNGLTLYGNINFDDITNSRFKSDEYLSYAAVQGGIIKQLPNFPMEIGKEITIVGPSMYSHKNNLTYMHDEMMLGFRHGANLLSFLCRVRFHFTRVSFGLMYENVQQGDLGNHPNNPGGEFKFLANHIERREFISANVDLRLIPELHIFTRYQFNRLPDGDVHYVFTGVGFKY